MNVQFGSLYKVTWQQHQNHEGLLKAQEKKWGKPIELISQDLAARKAVWAVDDEHGKDATVFKRMHAGHSRIDQFHFWHPRLKAVLGKATVAAAAGAGERLFKLRRVFRTQSLKF